MIRAALAVALLAASGCDCRGKEAAKPATASAEPPARVAAPDRAPRAPEPTARPPRAVPEAAIRRVLPLTVDDAIAAMPTLDARALAAPVQAPSGTQVRFTYCVDGAELDGAATSVVRALEGAGWQNVASRPPTGAARSPRHAVAAEKGDLRVSFTLQAVRRTGCDATVGGVFTTATMNRIAPPTP